MTKALAVVGAAILAVAAAPAAQADASSGTLFVRSAVEQAHDTVTLPLHRGTSHGQTVYYVVFDSSNGGLADTLGVNKSQKLANARGTDAVQKVTRRVGMTRSSPSTPAAGR